MVCLMENSATHYHNQQKSAVKTRPTGRILMNGRQWVKGIQAVLCGKSGMHRHNVWPNDHGLIELKILKIIRYTDCNGVSAHVNPVWYYIPGSPALK